MSISTSSSTSTWSSSRRGDADDLPWPVRRTRCSASAAPIPTLLGTTATAGTACAASSGWGNGDVLAASDYEKREKFLVHVGRYRAPAIAAHWEYLLTPLVPHTRCSRALRYGR